MQLLLEIHDSDILPDTKDLGPADFTYKQAARAVVSNTSGQIALLKVGKDNYHKLPGGGIEAGESVTQALERELMEEIGCQAQIIGEVGEITEYRNKYRVKQTSYCFKAKQIGDQQQPSFTQKELGLNFAIVWADNLEVAIATLKSDQPMSYEGKFIQKRELKFLETAQLVIPA